MYAFGVCEPRVVTGVSYVVKASYFIHRDFTYPNLAKIHIKSVPSK